MSQPSGEQPKRSTAQGAVDAVQAARTGAQVGAKVGGGWGAAAGAAVGAGTEVARNKKLRVTLIGLLVAAVLIGLAIPFGLGMAIGAGVADRGQRDDQVAVDTAAADGVTVEDVAAYKTAAASSGVHWTLIAAVDRAAGNWSGRADPPLGVDVDELNQAVASTTITPATEGLNPVAFTFGRLFSTRMVADHPRVDPYAIDAGVGITRDPTDARLNVRALDETNPDAVAAHEAARDAYVDVLTGMPTTAADQAERIFDTAFRWAIGQQNAIGAGACTPAGTTSPVGNGSQASIDTAPGTTNTDTGEEGGGASAGGGEAPAVPGFTAEQVENVAAVVAVGQELDLPERAWQIAIMTILVESQARNLDYGDRDSLGLFQQRPSSGWGTPQEIRTPDLAARAFYGQADHTSNPGLIDIDGWESMPMGDAAQAVQASAFPDAYAEREAEASTLLAAVAGEAAAIAAGATNTGECATGELGDFANCPVSPWPELETPPGLGTQIPPDALRTLRCGHQAFPEFTTVLTYGERAIAADEHGTGRAVDWMVPGGWQNTDGQAVADRMADWLVENHRPLGVEYIIWNQRIWSVARADEGWRPMEDRGSPTENHLDHVHVTLFGNKGVVAAPVADGAWTLPYSLNYQLGPGMCSDSGPCWGYSGHTGQDFTANQGAPVLAVSGGTVTTAEVLCPDLSNAQRAGNRGCSYGRYVIIDHGGGITSQYAHLDAFGPGIQEGTAVKAGQQIGDEGSQGNSTGSHLHLEIRKSGALINPVTYLEQQGVQVRCAPTYQGSYGAVPAGQCS